MQQKFIEWLIKQGGTVLFLSIASYVMWGQIEKILIEWQDCQKEKTEILLTVVKENTKSNYELINLLKIINNVEKK